MAQIQYPPDFDEPTYTRNTATEVGIIKDRLKYWGGMKNHEELMDLFREMDRTETAFRTMLLLNAGPLLHYDTPQHTLKMPHNIFENPLDSILFYSLMSPRVSTRYTPLNPTTLDEAFRKLDSMRVVEYNTNKSLTRYNEFKELCDKKEFTNIRCPLKGYHLLNAHVDDFTARLTWSEYDFLSMIFKNDNEYAVVFKYRHNLWFMEANQRPQLARDLAEFTEHLTPVFVVFEYND